MAIFFLRLCNCSGSAGSVAGISSLGLVCESEMKTSDFYTFLHKMCVTQISLDSAIKLAALL